MWCGEAILAVERSTKVGNDAANLIGSPITEVLSASLLEEVSESRVEGDATGFSICAF